MNSDVNKIVRKLKNMNSVYGVNISKTPTRGYDVLDVHVRKSNDKSDNTIKDVFQLLERQDYIHWQVDLTD